MKRYRSILFFLIAVCSFSCKKFVEVSIPSSTLNGEVIFTTDGGAQSAAAGLYSQMMQSNLNFANGGCSLFTALSADELINTSASGTYDPFRTNQILSKDASISGRFWNAMYRTIYHANAILEGLNHATDLTESTRKQIKGEMLVVRAFHYFYLINLFGDVPYITQTSYPENAVMGRTNTSIIYTNLSYDLEEAQSHLSSIYINGKGRPNKWVAKSLLARVNLYQQNWIAADSNATAVINSGSYSLNSIMSNVFVTGSNEIIWQLQRDNANTAEGSVYIPSSTSVKPAFALTTTLLNAFEAGDKRKASWIQQNTIGGQSYYYPYKYKVRTTTPVSEYSTALRLAELYLIRAEAKVQLGKTLEALQDINMIRNRAGLASITSQDTTTLLAAIEKERQTELFSEWGHRWLDLKRNGHANTILPLTKGSSWQPYAQLYPIPYGEIQKNPFLSQNTGY